MITPTAKNTNILGMIKILFKNKGIIETTSSIHSIFESFWGLYYRIIFLFSLLNEKDNYLCQKFLLWH